MEETSLNDVDLRLSYSSANLLRNCQRRFYHHKVASTLPDSDFNPDATSLVIGKSFHYILEVSKHEKPEKIGNLLEFCVKNFNLADEDAPLVHAMVLKYLRMHKKTNLECVACEYQIEDGIVNGFVDVIFKEKESDKWWIVDLKTSARMSPTLLPKLPQDRQLNLYSYFYRQIATKFNLNPEAFAGCRYRLTTKSTAKMKASENYETYVLRMADLINSYDIIIPKERMNPEEAMNEHIDLYDLSMKIRKGANTSCNFTYCDSFFNPCPYFSKCHNANFTDLKDSLEIIEE
jgi:hypothetical protein